MRCACTRVPKIGSHQGPSQHLCVKFIPIPQLRTDMIKTAGCFYIGGKLEIDAHLDTEWVYIALSCKLLSE